jgi:dUTP pyrophosphatase
MQLRMKLLVKKLNPDARVPEYAHKGDAGLDLYSCEDCIVPAGESRAVGTGIALEFDSGYAALIWDKSGIALKGITVLGGVIEHTYRGEYKVIMFNTSKKEYIVKRGDKVAQVLIQPISTVEVQETNELSSSVRGEKAFGSSGIR